MSFYSFGQIEDDISPITLSNVSSRQLETIYITVDETPMFPYGEVGLLRFYQENSKYKITGNEDDCMIVYYQVVIDEVGKATRFKILKGQSPDLDDMTRNIVNLMPNWKPGIYKGKPVKVVKNLSIKYYVPSK